VTGVQTCALPISVGWSKYRELMPQFNKVVVKVMETDREFSFETYDEFVRKISEA